MSSVNPFLLSFFFFFLVNQLEPGCLRQILQALLHPVFHRLIDFLIVCQVFNEKLSGNLCNFDSSGFLWAQSYPFLMFYFYKPGEGGPIMADLMFSIRFLARDTTADAV